MTYCTHMTTTSSIELRDFIKVVAVLLETNFKIFDQGAYKKDTVSSRLIVPFHVQRTFCFT